MPSENTALERIPPKGLRWDEGGELTATLRVKRPALAYVFLFSALWNFAVPFVFTRFRVPGSQYLGPLPMIIGVVFLALAVLTGLRATQISFAHGHLRIRGLPIPRRFEAPVANITGFVVSPALKVTAQLSGGNEQTLPFDLEAFSLGTIVAALSTGATFRLAPRRVSTRCSKLPAEKATTPTVRERSLQKIP